MTDETSASDGNDEAPNNEDSAWLVKQAKLAWDMGIREVQDIRELLENTNVETTRATVLALADSLLTEAERSREVLRRQAAILQKMVDGPTRIAQHHLSAQLAMLDRTAELAKEATIEELPTLMVAYSQMPRPYEDFFYWPVGKDTLDSEPSADE